MITQLLELASRADRLGIMLTRIGIIIVMLWIGGLKAFKYEADGIIPFVANSPFMSFLISSFGYTSASSRAHAPHIGAALKSSRTGRLLLLASAKALSTSLVH